MARFAALLISGHFATGVTYYEDLYSDEEQIARIVLPITVEGQLIVPAVVDTGAPWCVLAPDIVSQVGVMADAEYHPAQSLMIRGIRYEGKLVRMGIGLEAEQGESLDVEATVFVPVLPPGETWLHPNFLGLEGFLSRIRFAIDPAEKAFYFGPV